MPSVQSVRLSWRHLWNLLHHDDGRHWLRPVQRHRQGLQRGEDHGREGNMNCDQRLIKKIHRCNGGHKIAASSLIHN